MLNPTAGQQQLRSLVCFKTNLLPRKRKAAHILWWRFMQNSEQNPPQEQSGIINNCDHTLPPLNKWSCCLGKVVSGTCSQWSLKWLMYKLMKSSKCWKTCLREQPWPKLTAKLMAWIKLCDNIRYLLLKLNVNYCTMFVSYKARQSQLSTNQLKCFSMQKSSNF